MGFDEAHPPDSLSTDSLSTGSLSTGSLSTGRTSHHEVRIGNQLHSRSANAISEAGHRAVGVPPIHRRPRLHGAVPARRRADARPSCRSRQFGLLVSCYAFGACVSGLLTAGFADRFNRKKLLLVVYCGFLLATLLCGLAKTYHGLLFARLATGVFGGVLGSIGQAIVADLFAPSQRGRAMGTIQSAFSASQILGIPVGLFLAAHLDWHAPFWLITTVGVLVGIVILKVLEPIDAHLSLRRDVHPLRHLARTLTRGRYAASYLATTLVAAGGFMLMPFASAFIVGNLGIPFARVPSLYLLAGLVGLIAGPYLGKLSDKVGKLPVFAVASALGAVWVVWYTHLTHATILLVAIANAIFAAILSARMSSSMALISAVPAPPDRGAFMAISSSMTQLAGGVAAWISGMIVVREASGRLVHYDVAGWCVVAAMALTLIQMANIQRMTRQVAPENASLGTS
ncbi:MAG: MFS transporter [Polyangiaceae bacterium]